jgi:hypothetical protein
LAPSVISALELSKNRLEGGAETIREKDVRLVSPATRKDVMGD